MMSIFFSEIAINIIKKNILTKTTFKNKKSCAYRHLKKLPFWYIRIMLSVKFHTGMGIMLL